MNLRGGFLRLGIVGGTLLAVIAAPHFARAEVPTMLAQARALQAREQWAASESLATIALARLDAERAPDSLAVAAAFELIGIARWRTVGYADGTGLKAASRALGIRERRARPDALGLADAHALVARFLPETGRPDSAQFHVRRALAIRESQPTPDDTLVARTWDQLAIIQRNSADFTGALDSWTHAIELQTRVHGPEHAEIARLLAQTAVPWMEMGELERARAVLEESLRMFARTSPDDPRRWIALNLMADVERRTGNPALNFDLLQAALRIVGPAYGEDSREALTLRMNMGVTMTDLGDDAGCAAINREVLPLVESQWGPSHTRALVVRRNLALSSMGMSDWSTAEALLREEERILAAREGPPIAQLTTARGQLADLFYRRGLDAESRVMGELALRTARSTRQPDISSLLSVHQVHLVTLSALGDTAAVDTMRRELARLHEQYGLELTQWGPVDRLYLSRAARFLGREEEAWQHALKAEQLSRARVQTNLRALSDRRALLLRQEENRYVEKVVDLARGGDAARRETAWDRLVRTRGMLRAEIASRRRPTGSESDSAIAGLHDRWIAAQRALAQRIVSGGVAPRDSIKRLALEKLRAAAEQSETEYARALSSRGAPSPTSDVGLAEVRARLLPEQVLIGAFEVKHSLDWRIDPTRLPDSMVVFVARGGSDAIELIELGSSIELRAAVEPWLARLSVSPGPGARKNDPAEASSRKLGQAVRALTWDRIAPRLAGASDAFVVSDGPLVDLPWHALPDGKRGYLVEAGPRFHVLNAERELAEPPSAARSASLLALGAPDFDRDASGDAPATMQVAALVRSALDPCVDGALPSFAPLPGSGAEAEAAASAWRAEPGREATVLLGAAASEAAFKRGARGNAVLHLATHGVVAGDRCFAGGAGTRGVGGLEPLAATTPAKSSVKPAAATPAATAASPYVAPAPRSPWLPRRVWLALAGANRAREHADDDNEGILTAEEVITLDLEGTDWVVLSACHSGVAESWSRDGALGMRRAFDLAGARTVIASQWAVEDGATLEWMKALYAARASGAISASAAVEAASRTVLKARGRDGRSTHPFYWAAFGATGE